MRLQNAIYCSVTLLALLITSCSGPKKEAATLLIYGGPIYTVDTIQSTVEAVATKDNKILFAGSLEDAEKYKDEQTGQVDLS